ncbi:MAG: argininosuccinate synthase [bacterium JZ-2024 1]
MAPKKVVVLAFSGGLDTSFCAVWLRKELGADVVPVTVDTGGFERGDRARITARARSLCTRPLIWRDARHTLFRQYLRYLIFGNCLKGAVYPYCVSAERSIQATEVARVALRIGANAIAHGSTGAGNDQVRFDGALKALAPKTEILTPVRDLRMSRNEEIQYLRASGVEVEDIHRAFSVNRGMWGTTFGNRDLQDPRNAEAVEAIYGARKPKADRLDLTLSFRQGIPESVNGIRMTAVRLIHWLNREGGIRGAGFGVHTGTTVLGIKGRIAFKAPAATLLIRAHMELEKNVLTRDELFWKGILGEIYGDFLHRGLAFHPLMREIEAFLTTSQVRVSGAVHGFIESAQFHITAVDSPFSLFRGEAVYGESADWSPEAIKGFIHFHHLETQMTRSKGGGSDDTDGT